MMDAVANSYPWNIAGSSVGRSRSFWGAAQIGVAGGGGAGREVRAATGGNTKGHQADQRSEDGTSKADPRDGQSAQGPQSGDGGIEETEQCN